MAYHPDTNGARRGQKIVIIGGVAGGASCAARARRLDETAEILLLQSGPDVSFASCGMPYFIGGEITDRNQVRRMGCMLQVHVALLPSSEDKVCRKCNSVHSLTFFAMLFNDRWLFKLLGASVVDLILTVSKNFLQKIYCNAIIKYFDLYMSSLLC
jgi:hypothetical protein